MASWRLAVSPTTSPALSKRFEVTDVPFGALQRARIMQQQKVGISLVYRLCIFGMRLAVRRGAASAGLDVRGYDHADFDAAGHHRERLARHVGETIARNQP
jgi:hypothetical protein